MSEQVKEKRVKRPKSKARKIIEWILTGIFLALFGLVMAGQIDGMVHKKDHYNQQIRFGYGTFVVKTDSMEPEYAKQTALITYNEDPEKIVERFNKGEEVNLTFFDAYSVKNEYTEPNPEGKNTELTQRTDPTGLPMTHRLREVHVNNSVKKGQGKYTFITAGINTKSQQMGWREGDPELTINQYQAFTEKEILGRVVVNSPFLGGVFSFVSSVLGLLVLLLIPAFYLVITSVIDIFKAYKDPEEVKEGASGTSNPTGTVELSEADKKRLKEQLLEEMLNKKKGANNNEKE